MPDWVSDNLINTFCASAYQVKFLGDYSSPHVNQSKYRNDCFLCCWQERLKHLLEAAKSGDDYGLQRLFGGRTSCKELNRCLLGQEPFTLQTAAPLFGASMDCNGNLYRLTCAETWAVPTKYTCTTAVGTFICRYARTGLDICRPHSYKQTCALY